MSIRICSKKCSNLKTSENFTISIFTMRLFDSYEFPRSLSIVVSYDEKLLIPTPFQKHVPTQFVKPEYLAAKRQLVHREVRFDGMYCGMF